MPLESSQIRLPAVLVTFITMLLGLELASWQAKAQPAGEPLVQPHELLVAAFSVLIPVSLVGSSIEGEVSSIT